jgi:methylated-DNA-[protein]-cysteine S-methyltransferase
LGDVKLQQDNTEHVYDVVLDSPLGSLGIRCRDNRITRLDYVAPAVPLKAATTAFGRQVTAQLEQFFANPGHRFTLVLEMQGTAFQRRVWEALTRIPAGETLTYGELAARLHSGARAVGNACRHNPVSIIVPCHRVVSATGIGGYSGSTGGREIDRKQWLLGREGITGLALKIRQKSPTSGVQPDKQRNLHA